MTLPKRSFYIPPAWNTARRVIQEYVQRLFTETRRQGSEIVYVDESRISPNYVLVGDAANNTMFKLYRNREWKELRVQAKNLFVRSPNTTLTVQLLVTREGGGTAQVVFQVELTGSATTTIVGSSSTVVTSAYDKCVPGDTFSFWVTSDQTLADWEAISIEAEYEDWMPYTGQGARA